MNFQSKIVNYIYSDDDINQREVIVFHGKISKVEKGRYTQFFLNPEHPNDVNINVLCTTSGVVNVGLDSPHIRNIF